MEGIHIQPRKDGIFFRFNVTFGHWEYKIVGRDMTIVKDWEYIPRRDVQRLFGEYVDAVEEENCHSIIPKH
jgi:hypothetical protein